VALLTFEDERDRAAVSAVSVWEIAIKRSLGKLRIEDGWSRTLTRLGFEALPITAIHAAAVERLPWHHRDPFDRLLVAQAATEGLELVTADPRFAAYGGPVVW
jgi:PIN domain nuclease of toxin-antitoxin system